MENLNADCLALILTECDGYLPFMRQVCKQWRNFSKSSQKINIEILVKNNHISLLDWMNSNRPFTTNQIMKIFLTASYCGNEEILRMYASHSITISYKVNNRKTFYVEDALINAARGGSERCMRICHDWLMAGARASDPAREAKNIKKAMAEAAKAGKERCMRVCHGWLLAGAGASAPAWGATNVEESMMNAAEGNSDICMRICYDWLLADAEASAPARIARSVKHTMWYAARGGSEKCMRICYDWLLASARAEDPAWGRLVVNEAMAAAARGGSERCMRICYDWLLAGAGAPNVDMAMARAAAGGSERCMRICYEEWGATKLGWAMSEAYDECKDHLVRILKEWGKEQESENNCIAGNNL